MPSGPESNQIFIAGKSNMRESDIKKQMNVLCVCKRAHGNVEKLRHSPAVAPAAFVDQPVDRRTNKKKKRRRKKQTRH